MSELATKFYFFRAQTKKQKTNFFFEFVFFTHFFSTNFLGKNISPPQKICSQKVTKLCRKKKQKQLVVFFFAFFFSFGGNEKKKNFQVFNIYRNILRLLRAENPPLLPRKINTKGRVPNKVRF